MKHIVVDLEMNLIKKNDPARAITRQETIEIGAVMLDENYNEVSTFRTYVCPKHNTDIERKISKLTGITMDMVITAPEFVDAFRMFTNWCLGTGDEVKIYAWSESDYAQISKEIQLTGYKIDDKERVITDVEWNDFQKEFDEHIGFEKCIALNTALTMAGVEFQGRQHDALDDARNTAKLLMIYSDKNLFEETLAKIKEAMNGKQLSVSLGNIIDFESLSTAIC